MPGGRKTKLTEEVVRKLEEAIAMGTPFRLAAKYAGIAESTLHDWRAKKPEFSEQLGQVEGRAVVTLLALIQKAAQEDWRAAAWKLEKRYPEEFGKQVHELQGKDGGAIQIEATDARDRLMLEVDARRATIHEVPRLAKPDEEREEDVA